MFNGIIRFKLLCYKNKLFFYRKHEISLHMYYTDYIVFSINSKLPLCSITNIFNNEI